MDTDDQSFNKVHMVNKFYHMKSTNLMVFFCYVTRGVKMNSVPYMIEVVLTNVPI